MLKNIPNRIYNKAVRERDNIRCVVSNFVNGFKTHPYLRNLTINELIDLRLFYGKLMKDCCVADAFNGFYDLDAATANAVPETIISWINKYEN